LELKKCAEGEDFLIFFDNVMVHTLILKPY
jgi:hypothetical protein